MQTQLLVLQIPDGPSAALPHWRITRPTVLTAVEQLRRTDTLDPRLVSTAEPSDLRHEIISNRHRDRRVAQPDVGRDAAKAGSVRIQPALTAGEQLGGGIDGADENTGTNTTTLRPTWGRGQPRVLHQRDVRPGEIYCRQREPSEPGGTRQVGIANPAAEHV